MGRFPRPVVVVSACLEFEKVRYDGQVIPCAIVRELEPYVDYIKVCPEVAIGLGIPRDPIRIIKRKDEKRLIQPKTQDDLTEKMNSFTTGFISSLPAVDGFIFKSKSPTIGLRGIKVYAGAERAPAIERGSGFFAEQIMHAYPGYPMEEDDRLRNETIRHSFLVQLFCFADFRRTAAERSLAALQGFHEKNRFLFAAYSPAVLRELNDVVNTSAGKAIDAVLAAYFETLRKLFGLHQTPESRIRAVQQLFARYTTLLRSEEQTFFTGVIEEYRQNKICFRCLLELLASYALRFDDAFTLNQRLLEPYPKELVVVVDPKRDRDFWKADPQ
ncbi:MAG: YbgA family protein [Candidatus Methanospirareceae archaeon]